MHPGEILWTVVIGFVLVGSVGYFLSIYNSLIEMKNNIGRSWANIDVLLKQRHDELPKLVKVCEAYMQHERGVFDKLSEARAALAGAASVRQRADAENAITRALGGFFAVAENYPDLKANNSFTSLQQRISELENAIADRREFYNDTVAMFNTRIEQIPDSWVAGGMNLQPAELFKIDESERKDVDIAFKMTA
ncbi:MAG: LemA family protein [Candidatus Eisenbacteria bacterium]|nr:LemA family protein [Candidatus Eisenbacteria bacterium]